MAKRDLVRESVRQSVLFARHVVPAAVRPARTLWNELLGFIFLVFALSIGGWMFPSVIHFDGTAHDVIKLSMGGVSFLVMLYYGISSFRRARRISRS